MVEIEGVEQVSLPAIISGTYGETSLVTKKEDLEGSPIFIVLSSEPDVLISVDRFEDLTNEQRASLLTQYNLEM
jgi:hypothetical protein